MVIMRGRIVVFGAVVGSLALAVSPASAIGDPVPVLETTPYSYQPVGFGVLFTTGLPRRVQAISGCGYVPVDVQSAGVETNNNVSVSLEVWTQGGSKLASDTLIASYSWNPTLGATRMELFSCDWDPGEYSLSMFAAPISGATKILVNQSPLSVEAAPPPPGPTVYTSATSLKVAPKKIKKKTRKVALTGVISIPGQNLVMTRASVTIYWAKPGGKWKVAATATTNDSGAYSVSAAARKGYYYASYAGTKSASQEVSASNSAKVRAR